jgi:hypothetical protein
MQNAIIQKFVYRVRHKPLELVSAFLFWLVVETTKHRLFAWLNSRIDQETGPAIRLLALIVSWIVGHGVEFALLIAVGYCLVIIIGAQLAVEREKRSSRRSEKLGEIGFIHDGETVGHRWTTTIAGTPKPSFVPLAAVPFANSVEIRGPFDPGIDHEVPPYPALSKRLRYAASFPGHAAVYTYVKVTDPHGSTHNKWLQHVFGHGDEPVADTDAKDERKVFVSGKPLKDGWLQFELFLPDEVQRAYAPEGFVYSSLIKIRLRGSLSISPIELYRD